MSGDGRFTKGQSGNPGGRPKLKYWKEALKRQVELEAESGAPDKLASGLDKLAKAVVRNAMAGDKDAWREIGDRIDGKVAQQVIATGDEDGGPISVVTRIELVDLDGSGSGTNSPTA